MASEYAKHTAGPWRLRALTNDTLAVYGQGEYDIVFPLRGAVIDANAALIVQAPDLLTERDALKAALRELWEATEEHDVAFHDHHMRGKISKEIYKVTLLRYNNALTATEALLNPREAADAETS